MENKTCLDKENTPSCPMIVSLFVIMWLWEYDSLTDLSNISCF